MGSTTYFSFFISHFLLFKSSYKKRLIDFYGYIVFLKSIEIFLQSENKAIGVDSSGIHLKTLFQ